MTEQLNDKKIGKVLMESLAVPVADSLSSIFTYIFTDAFTATSKARRSADKEGVGVHVELESVEEKERKLEGASQAASTKPKNVTNGGLFDLESAYAQKVANINSRTQWTWEEYERRQVEERMRRRNEGFPKPNPVEEQETSEQTTS